MSLKTVLVVVLCVAWGLGVVSGFTALAKHGGTAGASAATPARWPADAAVALDAGAPTLLLFAHPQCPCTGATIEELNRVLARCGPVQPTVLFYGDPALGAAWTDSPLRAAAEAIPGVQVLDDPLGATAELFGARTSGQVLLYAPDGTLLFEGGITPGRGHAGNSAGRSAILKLLQHEKAGDRSPVYGCSLVTPERAP